MATGKKPMAKPEQQQGLVDAIMQSPGSPDIEVLKKRILELELKRLEQELQTGAEYRAQQMAVAQIAIEKDAEEKAAKAKDFAQMLQMQKEGAAASLKVMHMNAAVQAGCPHLHEESNRPTTVGVRLWGDRITINCGRCGMTDTGTRMELVQKYGNAFPKDENIGGPLPPGAAELLGIAVH